MVYNFCDRYCYVSQVRAAVVVFYLLGKLQVEGVMRDL